MDPNELAEHDALVRANQELTEALSAVRRRLAALSPHRGGYRLALRPQERYDDPMRYDSPLDDIVVKGVPTFRAEDMGDSWWVCCYLDDDTHDRICWSVRAVKKGVIEWTTTEYPSGPVVYEHEQERP